MNANQRRKKKQNDHHVNRLKHVYKKQDRECSV